VDSERKLQHARATKQRRLEQQVALEVKLDRLKYNNGQQRAELQKAHELLSEGQRQLNAARSAAAKAGDDLREFDRKLKFALEIKSSLLAHQRTQDRLLDELRNKAAILNRLVKEAEEQCEEAQQEFDKAKHYEENLRQCIRNEAANQQRIADKTAEARAESAAHEQELDQAFKLEKSLKLRVENIRNEEAKERARDADVDVEAQQGKHKRILHEMAEKKARLKDAVDKKKNELHQIWHQTIAIQNAEGHTPSQPPSQSNRPPVLDLDRIRASVQAESDAAMEETKAKEQLRAAVENLQKQLSDLNVEQSTTSSNLKELQAANENAAKIEAERKAANDKLIAELEQVNKAVEEKSRLVHELRSVQDSECAELNKKLGAVSLEIHTAKEKLEHYRQQNVDIDAEIIEAQATYDELKEVNQKELQTLETKSEEACQRSRDLQEEVSRINDERLPSNRTKEQRARRKKVDEARQKIAETVESK
jgi:hypothetical protein